MKYSEQHLLRQQWVGWGGGLEEVMQKLPFSVYTYQYACLPMHCSQWRRDFGSIY